MHGLPDLKIKTISLFRFFRIRPLVMQTYKIILAPHFYQVYAFTVA